MGPKEVEGGPQYAKGEPRESQRGIKKKLKLAQKGTGDKMWSRSVDAKRAVVSLLM